MKRIFLIILVIMAWGVVDSAIGQKNIRIKDVATISGLEDVQVFGYGLVVGLAGTGDRNSTVFTNHTIQNMLKSMGIELPDKQIRVRNVASVMVTGTLAPFKRTGTRFDVTVSSMGDATSLDGGMLILTPVQGPDGIMYASAQGPIATGGYDIRNSGTVRMSKNHVAVGRIPDGAIVQREYKFNVLNGDNLSLSLSTPDFSSAVSMAKSINEYFKERVKTQIARAVDASTVQLDYALIVRDSIRNYLSIVDFISQVENVTFDMATQARVVMNERTGTIVAGGSVRISEVAVTHGGIKIEIVNQPEVVQPYPFTNGTTTVVQNPKQHVIEEKDMDMVVLNGTTTVSDLAQALNSLGVAPRDIIAIFQAIKEAGALMGQLIIM